MTHSPCGEGFTRKDSHAFKGKTLTPSPCGKNHGAFIEEISVTPSSCREKFVREIALHLRWKNFKKACSFPTISNRWGRTALHLGRDYLFKYTKTSLLFSNDFNDSNKILNKISLKMQNLGQSYVQMFCFVLFCFVFPHCQL